MQSSTLILATVALLATAVVSGCASSGKTTAEASPGKFVTYACEENKSFQIRFDPENRTARIRSHEGSAELARGARGLYRDDEGQWILTLGDGTDTELWFQGKTKYKHCAAK